MKQVLNAYLDMQTGEKFKVWETEASYLKRDEERYKQIGCDEVQK